MISRPKVKFDRACKRTKFDDSSFRRSRDILGGVNASRGPDHAHLGDS